MREQAACSIYLSLAFVSSTHTNENSHPAIISIVTYCLWLGADIPCTYIWCKYDSYLYYIMFLHTSSALLLVVYIKDRQFASIHSPEHLRSGVNARQACCFVHFSQKYLFSIHTRKNITFTCCKFGMYKWQYKGLFNMQKTQEINF